ncbi:hypothetical protein [Mycoplasma simbae]|uniref:hypothetical protein n=1 Tax=Mycoplasma simbae TaxID=36744 RepID=UPI0004980D79|nr:hypothetical protein [Mycoplasma simbae]
MKRKYFALLASFGFIAPTFVTTSCTNESKKDHAAVSKPVDTQEILVNNYQIGANNINQADFESLKSAFEYFEKNKNNKKSTKLEEINLYLNKNSDLVAPNNTINSLNNIAIKVYGNNNNILFKNARLLFDNDFYISNANLFFDPIFRELEIGSLKKLHISNSKIDLIHSQNVDLVMNEGSKLIYSPNTTNPEVFLNQIKGRGQIVIDRGSKINLNQLNNDISIIIKDYGAGKHEFIDEEILSVNQKFSENINVNVSFEVPNNYFSTKFPKPQLVRKGNKFYLSNQANNSNTTFEDNNIKSIKFVAADSAKHSYLVGEAFDFSNLSLLLTDSNGNTKTIEINEENIALYSIKFLLSGNEIAINHTFNEDDVSQYSNGATVQFKIGDAISNQDQIFTITIQNNTNNQQEAPNNGPNQGPDNQSSTDQHSNTADEQETRTIFVQDFPGQNSGGNGTEQNPFRNIKDAINAANNNDTIVLKNNVILQTDSNNNSYRINKNVVIDGRGHSLNIRGNNLVLASDLTLKDMNLSFTAENANSNIYLSGHMLKMQNVSTLLSQNQQFERPIIRASSFNNSLQGTKSHLIVEGTNNQSKFKQIDLDASGNINSVFIEIKNKNTEIFDGIVANNSSVSSVIESKSNKIGLINNQSNSNLTIKFYSDASEQLVINNFVMPNKVSNLTLENAIIRLSRTPVFVGFGLDSTLSIDSTSRLEINNDTSDLPNNFKINIGQIKGEGVVQLPVNNYLNLKQMNNSINIELDNYNSDPKVNDILVSVVNNIEQNVNVSLTFKQAPLTPLQITKQDNKFKFVNQSNSKFDKEHITKIELVNAETFKTDYSVGNQLDFANNSLKLTDVNGKTIQIPLTVNELNKYNIVLGIYEQIIQPNHTFTQDNLDLADENSLQITFAFKQLTSTVSAFLDIALN